MTSSGGRKVRRHGDSLRLFIESLNFGTVIDEAQLVPAVLIPLKEGSKRKQRQ